jgi:hypothetical protein
MAEISSQRKLLAGMGMFCNVAVDAVVVLVTVVEVVADVPAAERLAAYFRVYVTDGVLVPRRIAATCVNVVLDCV